MSNRKINKKAILWASIFVFMIGIIPLIMAIFVNNKETYISNSFNSKIGLLYCTAENLENSFFSTEGATKTLHEIKITFKGDGPDKISYIYSGDYPNAKTSEYAKSLASYRLGSYLSGKTPKSEDLNPRYSLTNNSLHVIVNADDSLLTTLTAPIFYLDGEKANNFKTYSDANLKEYYEERGFVCKI